MAGKKQRSSYRPKRKGKGFGGSKRKGKLGENTPLAAAIIDRETPSTSHEERDLSDSECAQPLSSSAKKMKLYHSPDESSKCLDDESTEQCEATGYRLINLESLSSVLSEAHECEEANIILQENESGRAGLKSDLTITCSACDESISFQTSANITKRGKSFDVNKRAVYHSLESGTGYEGLASFCGIMNMPCMSTSAYQKQVDSILEVVEDYTKEELTQAGQRLRNIVLDENPDLDKDDTLDVAVSFDGTWAKRGFTSLTGVVFAISVDSGEVLDYTVLSKACQKCSLKQSKCEGDDERFQEWRREHLASGECDINFNGSSPAMEAEGASILWRRSIELHNMHYKWMVSDGDSKAFNTVENVYDDCKVIKLDCVGHVQKRMGKHLLNLKARTKGKLEDGKPIGGRGRLTETKIKKLQKYYGLAIRQNTIKKSNPTDREVDVSIYTMKKNIIAILNHSVKTQDPAKQHRFCPLGETSWCKWQQDVTTATKTYKDDDCLPEVFLELLRPAFMTLSDTKLLERCIRGTTQNPNECINGTVWVRCPKHKHHGAKVVRYAAASAICHFHKGAECRNEIMDKLSIPGGSHTTHSFRLKNNKRLRKANAQATAMEKKRRQGLQLVRTRREEALLEIDGPSYDPGGF
ncbi:uncharacterized protein [Pocillopora verrucosa]|uniref:uncharacterized protein n=1 Tax=Pocillopora verrucosa TaxID=203993 RepID=UPI0027974BC6|nr:uncharacterized protein LOC131788405 [Pocillopora verrucosa]